MPHLLDGRIINTTPLANITNTITGAASACGIVIKPDSDYAIFAKQEWCMPSGSIKMRPAAEIIRNAIIEGKLKSGMTVFEATSGNFGIALSQLAEFGIKIVSIVSRKLDSGVIEMLDRNGVKIIYANTEICPVPGLQNSSVRDISIINNVLSQLDSLGFDTFKINHVRNRLYEAIYEQDSIAMAKLLAEAYGGFCPNQYANNDNLLAYREVLGKELDQQLKEFGYNPEDFKVVCAFGTGGTSTGLSQHALQHYGIKNVIVAFPLQGQDVAGIRTKENATALPFYKPDMYYKEVRIDFSKAKELQSYLRTKGLDIGESSALVLYAAMQEIARGEKRIVAILADSNKKYQNYAPGKEFSLEEIKEKRLTFGTVIWAHPAYAPNADAISIIAKAFNKEIEEIKVIKAETVARVIDGNYDGLDIGNDNAIAVCVGGIASKKFAEALAKRGVQITSLKGGLIALASELSPESHIEDLIE
ncbi:MAG: pyridoxal-phosphate dependent enzyme [Candidatus Micrarchaeaceae archaeon]